MADDTVDVRASQAGFFRISNHMVRSDEAAVKVALVGFLPSRVEQSFNVDELVCWGHHDAWPPIPYGVVAPEYFPTITREDDGSVTVEWRDGSGELLNQTYQFPPEG